MCAFANPLEIDNHNKTEAGAIMEVGVELDGDDGGDEDDGEDGGDQEEDYEEQKRRLTFDLSRENTGRERWQRYWPNTRSGGDCAQPQNYPDHYALHICIICSSAGYTDYDLAAFG